MTTILLDTYNIGASSVTISPQRGASISSLVLDGVETFYSDPERRNDFNTTIREGFWMGPQVGLFTFEQLAKYGYDLQQHGFLRDVTWKKGKVEGNEIEYQFDTNDDTFKKFPHLFTASQKITLEDNRANMSLNIKNIGQEPLQFAPGYHTYYKIDSDKKEDIQFGKNVGLTDEMKAIRLSGEETVVIPNPGSCQVFIPGIGLLQLDFDPGFGYLRLRTEKDKGFVCIEPVTCNPEDWDCSAISIEPGEDKEILFSICLLSKDI